MKASVINTAVVSRVVVLALLLFQTTTRAQDLEMPWGNYISIDAELERVVAAEQEWLAQQHKLNEEIRELQGNRSWYNGWIVEVVSARKSARQVVLADSLQQIRDKVTDLTARRDDAFLALREAYQRILLESGSESQLSIPQKEQAITIGHRLISQNDDMFNLPDYSSIISSPYEDDVVKRLVLEDLQSVLQAKLVLIDSFLTEKETEAALLVRLNEFHRDLGYQMQADLDLGSGGSGEEESATTLKGYFFTDNRELFGGEDLESWDASGTDPNLSTPLDQSRNGSGGVDIQMDATPIDEAIKLLTSKRQQYQDLIRQIETDLAN
ncbi:hypothetical protein ACFL4K_01105 [Candidatus Neomarinimicrobiota bacterium]